MALKPDFKADVEFGGVSIGDTTARLGAKISRELIGLDTADDLFAGRQLKGSVKLAGNGEATGQKKLKGMSDAYPSITGVFESKRFGCNSATISLNLTMNLDAIDVKELARFAKKKGQMAVTHVSDLADEDKDEEGDDE